MQIIKGLILKILSNYIIKSVLDSKKPKNKYSNA